MSTDNIDWIAADQYPPNFASGASRGKVYVLFPIVDGEPIRLMAFDVCQNSWSKVALDFSAADLHAATSGYCSVSWKTDRYVCIPASDAQGNVPSNAAEFIPDEGRLRRVPLSSVTAKDPVWQLPPPATYRHAIQASSKDHILVWGGDYQNSAATGNQPTYWPSNDGQVYSYEAGVWKSVTATGAPSARYLPKIVALGERFLIWGGFSSGAAQYVDPASALADGAIYDPVDDRFTPISALGAPPQPQADYIGSPATMLAFSNGNDVFVVDSVNGAGGVYSSELDRWYSLPATTSPGAALLTKSGLGFQLLDNGDLIWIGPEEVRVASKRGGAWRSFRQGPYRDALTASAVIPASPIPTFDVSVWTANTLMQWGASTVSKFGCDQPPTPGLGCDPLYIYANYKFGALLSAAALMQP